MPIDLGGPNDSVFLSLYGTGIRGRTAQSPIPGLDQINVQLPRVLAGRGEVDAVVKVDGRAANVVRIAIR